VEIMGYDCHVFLLDSVTISRPFIYNAKVILCFLALIGMEHSSGLLSKTLMILTLIIAFYTAYIKLTFTIEDELSNS